MKPKNIFYEKKKDIKPYRTKRTSRHSNPKRDYKIHGEELLEELINIKTNIEVMDGSFLEFTSKEGFSLKIDQLKNDTQKIKLLDVKKEKKEDEYIEKALVYLPKGKEKYFNMKIDSYLKSEGKKNRELIDSIQNIKSITLESFWKGKLEDIPDQNPVWCEVWIQIESKSEGEFVSYSLLNKIKNLEIQVNDKFLIFEERIVFLVNVNKENLLKLLKNIKFITEIKKNYGLTTFFLNDIDRQESYEWIDALKHRTKNINKNIGILLIDSGVANGHPLIKNYLTDNECKGYKKDDTKDDIGHGTAMAGLALYGELEKVLLSDFEIELSHRLKSFKILYNDNNSELYGSMTTEAVLFSENSKTTDIICMAVASKDLESEKGYASSWSSTIDELAFGDERKKNGRLFCLSAGNVETTEAENFPNINKLSYVENPGQSWNSLTVGAYTEKIFYDQTSEREEVAQPFDLSPYTKTSVLWYEESKLIKPEILLEGGNLIKDKFGCLECEELSLLSTNNDFLNRFFTNFSATSAATALASNMCAKIQGQYPEAWPQTIRGLLVHSAEWTDQMKKSFLNKTKPNKNDYALMLRTCGYGVPNLNKALGLLQNSVNLIIQDEIKPFKYDEINKRIAYNELHIHEIPWPKDLLCELADKKFQVKITLSYFIEPNPSGEIGINEYKSCGLRFLLSGTRNKEELIKKISRSENNEKYKDDAVDKWTYGTRARDTGSVHSDIWCGTGADFSESNYVLIHPTTGWWKQKKKSNKYNEKLKYSLIVSITSEEEKIDLFTPIYQNITIENKILLESKL